MPSYPDLSDPDDNPDRYFSHHPVEGLTDDEIDGEAEHWEEQLDQSHRQEEEARNAPSTPRRITRWGGLSTAALGVLTVFAAPPIGLPVALAGFGVAVYGELHGRREQRSRQDIEEKLRSIRRRLRELNREARRRLRERGANVL